MKKIKYILSMIAAVVFITTGCTKKVTTEDNSTLEYFVAYDLVGGNLLKIEVGDVFVDPGFVATEQGQDVTNKVTVTGSVDGLTVGLYTLNYSATNKNGYKSAATRTIIIYDPAAPATDIGGNYSTSILRTRTDGGPDVFKFGYTLVMEKLAPGFFSVSDFFGGYYDQYLGYGPGYACTGYVQLNADNTLTLVSSSVSSWGDSLDDLVDGTYDPAAKKLFWRADYAGFLRFNVTSTFESEL